MKFRPITVDTSGRELTEHGTAEFPVSMDEQVVSDRGIANIPHWHDEVQIVRMSRGSALFRVAGGDYLIQEGEGIFINSRQMHEVIPTEDFESVYICVNFLSTLIAGQVDSIIRRDYVEPTVSAGMFAAIPLQSEPWHRQLLEKVEELTCLFERQPYGYELSTQILLLEIWRLLVTNNRLQLEAATAITFSEKQRMTALVQFIHKHYMDRISLADIADAAHISRGECCRAFARIQHQTPFEYLLNYRVSESMKLLASTGLSIAEIAQQVGFGSSSYYTERFKRCVRCTPMQYRKRIRTESGGEIS